MLKAFGGKKNLEEDTMYIKSLMINEVEEILPTYAGKELESPAEARLKYRHKEGFFPYMGSEEHVIFIVGLKKAKSKLDIELGAFFQRKPSLEENKKFGVKFPEMFLPYKKIEEKALEPWPAMLGRKVRPKAPVARPHAPLPWPVTSEELQRRVREYCGLGIASLLERVVVRL
ncbi:MAG: hypothetical protein AOA66_0138 [Candidatus Bathyarchaeota archaeon BA2]|nr:MAG: hypothetical protein AOA66_0138 [Candidatus Bathyarchaeota archaeon BA2]